MTPTTNGEDPVDVSIVLEFWDDPGDPTYSEQVAASVPMFLDSLFPDGKPPTPHDCIHPVLSLHKIRSLFFLEWDGPKSIGTSHWQIALKACNFKPPTKKVATYTPHSSTPTTPGNVLVPPRSGIDAGSSLFKPWTPPKSPDASKPRP